MTQCDAIWHPNDELTPGITHQVYPCFLAADHDGPHEPQDDPIEYTPSAPSPNVSTEIDLPEPSPTATPAMAGSFALYPHGTALYAVVSFDIPEGEQIRGAIPAELVDLLIHGKKPSPLQLAKLAATLMAA
jgi:hypothetical protein